MSCKNCTQCGCKTKTALSEMLTEYREGERDLPTHDELAALVAEGISPAPHDPQVPA